MSTAAVTEGMASSIVQPGKQTVDYTCLVACAAELNRDWAPSKVENVLMADPNTLVMQLRTLESSGWLYLSWHPLAARMSLGGPPERGEASEAYSFAKQAAQHLRGQVLQSAQLPEAWERVLCLSFGARPGEPAGQQLFCEVQARRSNLILTHADRRVLAAAHQVGQKHSSLRQVRVGAEYRLPPPPRGIAPSPDEPGAEWRRNVVSAASLARAEAVSPPAWAAGREATVAEGLMRAYLAVSPSLSSDLCSLAGVSPYAAAEQLDDAAWSRLHRQWLRWLDGLRSGEFDCGRCTASGSFSVLGAFSAPLHSARYGSVLEMLHDCYAELQVQERFKQMEQALLRSVAVAERKLKARLASFDKQLGSEEQEAAARKQADMLMAVLHCVEPGADSVTVEDWETGEQVELTLDPERTPLESAQALYKRAGKLRRGQAVLQPLRGETMQQLAYVEEVRAALQQLASDFAGAQDLRALYEIQDELVEARIVQPPPDASLAAKGAAKARRAAKRQGKRAGSEFREFRSPGGMQVLVGRNNKQNDRLTFHVASKQDLWMHARGVPGCHLVLRPPPGQAAAHADLEFAAHLAAYYSKARNDSKVPVIVTEVSNIKKPKGAPPGKVACLKEEVIIGCPNRSAAAQQQPV